jgi:hypothetical protein
LAPNATTLTAKSKALARCNSKVDLSKKSEIHHRMNAEFQIDIPATFMALYVPPGKIKPTLGQRELAARYELCEDLANLLTEKAANMQFTLGITEELVLAQCEAGLLAEPAVVIPGEARWVVCRLAELLQWPMAQLLQSTSPKAPR